MKELGKITLKLLKFQTTRISWLDSHSREKSVHRLYVTITGYYEGFCYDIAARVFLNIVSNFVEHLFMILVKNMFMIRQKKFIIIMNSVPEKGAKWFVNMKWPIHELFMKVLDLSWTFVNSSGIVHEHFHALDELYVKKSSWILIL